MRSCMIEGLPVFLERRQTFCIVRAGMTAFSHGGARSWLCSSAGSSPATMPPAVPSSKIDEIAKNLVSSRPGATSCVVWTSHGFPVDNTGDEDTGLRNTGTTLDNGTVFRVLELAPGASPRNHRTDSIDYAVVMSGEIDMELDGSS